MKQKKTKLWALTWTENNKEKMKFYDTRQEALKDRKKENISRVIKVSYHED